MLQNGIYSSLILHLVLVPDIVYFHLTWGNDPSFPNIFQMGWFNHQLVLKYLQFDMFSLHQNNGPFEVTFPESLQTLTLGHHFNRDLTDVDFPSHLRSLTLGQRFTWSLHHVNLPNSLCNLFCQNLLVSCD